MRRLRRFTILPRILGWHNAVMASDEFLARMDEHMARSNEHMARGNEHMARGNEHMERGNKLMAEVKDVVAQVRAEVELSRRSYEDQLRITREMNRRNEIAIQENSRITSEQIDAIREIRVGLREVQEEARAQTRAIFQVLDRFGGGAEPAGA